jgi:hypothetical protein
MGGMVAPGGGAVDESARLGHADTSDTAPDCSPPASRPPCCCCCPAAAAAGAAGAGAVAPQFEPVGSACSTAPRTVGGAAAGAGGGLAAAPEPPALAWDPPAPPERDAWLESDEAGTSRYVGPPPPPRDPVTTAVTVVGC